MTKLEILKLIEIRYEMLDLMSQANKNQELNLLRNIDRAISETLNHTLNQNETLNSNTI